MNIFSDDIKSGDVLRAETYQNLLNFVKGSSVAGGTVGADGICVPSEYERSPRIVRFRADEDVKSYSIIRLTEHIETGNNDTNVVPTFKATPATGGSGALFYTAAFSTCAGNFGMAYTIGGEPILIRSTAESDGIPENGAIIASSESEGGVFRYLSKSLSPDLKWFLPPSGGGGAHSNPRVRLVQRKELFPACEYKTLQNVYDCTLEYSDDNADWTVAATFNIVGGRVSHTFNSLPLAPHRYWRVNLKGFSLPENPTNPLADRGFFTFGRLWGVRFETTDGSLQTAEYADGSLPPTGGAAATLLPSAVCRLPSAIAWDSKPTPRKSQNHRIWKLTFDQPELVTSVTLDVDRHVEHYIVCPGGRDASGNVISFIYAFDLATEQWTATTFPEMREPMFNMDAKVTRLTDNTYNLVVLSGQTKNNHFSGTIQGYNFEKNQVQEGGGAGLSFAGRPALWDENDDYFRSNASLVSRYPRRLIVLGGGNRSVDVWTNGTTAHYSSIFALNPADFILGQVHNSVATGATTTITSGVGGLFNPLWTVTFVTSGAGTVGRIVEEQLLYSRHQNLPVRGFRRQRPIDVTTFPRAAGETSVVDFILIGGFNTVNSAQFNRTVVSGMLGSPMSGTKTTWSATDYRTETFTVNANNTYNNFIRYPASQYVLGDCCAEYIEERDEIICFGGRATETDTAVAHAIPATLVFNAANEPASVWNYNRQRLFLPKLRMANDIERQ